MDRSYELENLRRSIAMLSPQAPSGLTREQAMVLIAEMRDAEQRLKRLRDGLARLLEAEGAD